MIGTRLASSSQIIVLLLAVATSLLLAGCGQPDPSLEASAAQSGDDPGGRILFVADGDVQMWDDGDIERITDVSDEMVAESPSWAPDGTRFAYVQADRQKGFSDLFVADLDGETLRQVTTNEPDVTPFSQEFVCNAYWVRDPVWDPAGERLIWASDREGWEFWDACANRLSDPMFLWYSETWEAEPYILSASASINRHQEDPTLSPDGGQAAFVARAEVSDTLKNAQIWLLDLNTAETTELVVHPEGAYDPAWSPDGDNIAYIQRNGTRNDLWIAPVDGGAPYRLTDIGTCVSPVWSPDGRFIAFFRESDGNFEASYVEVEASANGQLTASDPQRLFTADNIDTTSGMSWAND